MIDERMYNLLRDQLSFANEERSQLYSQVRSLTDELVMLRQSMKEGMDSLRSVIASLEARIAGLLHTIESKECHIRELEIALGNALAELKQARAGRFTPTTEQQRLLNNRASDTCSVEKGGF